MPTIGLLLASGRCLAGNAANYLNSTAVMLEQAIFIERMIGSILPENPRHVCGQPGKVKRLCAIWFAVSGSVGDVFVLEKVNGYLSVKRINNPVFPDAARYTQTGNHLRNGDLTSLWVLDEDNTTLC